MKSVKYDDINSFIIENNKYLFFDIFHKNNEVILICPVYNKKYYSNNILLKQNNTILKLKKKILKIEYEPISILIYKFKSNSPINEITVTHNKKTQKFYLVNKKTKKNKLLCQTTLFKNDYDLINLFYDYYTNQGVQYFYLYYNDILNENVKNICDNKNIKLIQWNYHYWNDKDCDFKHHAQLGQMHHALYKYGKNEFEYMIFNDLDEYMHINNKRLIDLVSNKKYDTYGFCNIWANSIDNVIPNKFPKQIQIGIKSKFGYRSKCIHKTSSVNAISIHKGKKNFYSTKNIKTKNIYNMFHFYNWCKTKRKISTPIRYDISNNKKTLNKRAAKKRVAKKRAAKKRAIKKKVAKKKEVKKKAANKKAIKKKAVNKKAVNKKAVNKKTVNKKTVNKKAINKKTVNKKTENKNNDKSINKTINKNEDQIINNKAKNKNIDLINKSNKIIIKNKKILSFIF
jgi:hypothetical protein